MKTLLSSGITGLFALGLFGCSGAGDEAGEPTAPVPTNVVTPDSPSVEAPPSPSDTGSSDVPDTVAAESPPSPPDIDLPTDFMGEPHSPPVAPRPALSWRPCGQFDDRNIECAELEVPIDYQQPEGETLTLALRRVLANPLEPHRGSLLFNPGGPGGEGIDIALSVFRAQLFDAVAPGFDIIGFDPRGVAESGERGCGISAPDLYPGAQRAEALEYGAVDYVDYFRAVGEDCEEEWGPLFRKLGSNNVVKDMEAIRQALAEPVLNFYGMSYGTRLGALYAHAYPETTGRIVLDAPVPPRTAFVEMLRDQYYQGLALTEQLFTWCEDATITCTPDARQVFDQMIANARARGIEVQVAAMWLTRLNSAAGADSLMSALAAEAADPGGAWIESFIVGESDGGSGDVAFNSVTCTDDMLEPPTSEQLANLEAEFQQASPVFGSVFAAQAARCAGWPTTRDPVPLATAIDAPPLLVIGGTFDSRTPFPWAREMTETLGNATLLTSIHWGHVALGNGGDCLRANIRAYLTSGSLPATGATCQ